MSKNGQKHTESQAVINQSDPLTLHWVLTSNLRFFSPLLHAVFFALFVPLFYLYRHTIIPPPWSICLPCLRESTTHSVVRPPTSSETLQLAGTSRARPIFSPPLPWLPLTARPDWTDECISSWSYTCKLWQISICPHWSSSQTSHIYRKWHLADFGKMHWRIQNYPATVSASSLTLGPIRVKTITQLFVNLLPTMWCIQLKLICVALNS